MLRKEIVTIDIIDKYVKHKIWMTFFCIGFIVFSSILLIVLYYRINSPKIEQLNWEEINKLVDEERFEDFVRSKESSSNYGKNKIIIKNTYGSIKDMILIKTLNYDSIKKEDNKLYAEKKEDSYKYHLIYNDFPYSITDDVLHLVLWSDENLTIEEGEKILNKKLKGLKYIFYRNPEYLRSVPAVFHFQVFVKL